MAHHRPPWPDSPNARAEASRGYRVERGVSLTPSVEVGLRHDGGDAETGAGMDVGAGLIVSDTSTGLAVDVRVRMLLETELGYGLPVGSRLIGTPRVDEAANLYHDVASGVRDDRPELDSRLA